MKNRISIIICFVLVLFVFSSCALLFQGGEDKGEGSTQTGGKGENNAEGGTADGDTHPEIDTDKYIPITLGGEAKITFVSAYYNTPTVESAINGLKSVFSEAGITFEKAYATTNKADDYEILIGERVGASDKYYLGEHDFGVEGYAIRVIDNKIIINGGCDEMLVKAIAVFREEVISLGTADVNNVAVPRETNIFVRQYYPITAFTVAGESIEGFDIVIGYERAHEPLGEMLRNAIYESAGYWLEIENTSKGRAIIISTVENAGEEGFRVGARDGNLVIECSYPAIYGETLEEFIDMVFMSDEERRLDFVEGVMQSIDISTISYCGFGGAVGDGIADDFDAIRRTHDRANITGQTVVADSGKTFNLGQHAESIKIKTDTVWTGATFIIDDSNVAVNSAVRTTNVFTVMPDAESYAIALPTLSKGQQNIGTTLKTDVLLRVVDDNTRQYIRYGENADSGASQQEIILVHRDGSIDPATPVLWDYPTVTTAIAYPVEDKPISITGGHFITIANTAPRQYNYYKRGIAITRSNVTMTGILHTIEGEGSTGAPYAGFTEVSLCNNILFDSMVFTGHKTYKLLGNDNNSMGTYEINASWANNITWLNCSQTNNINDTAYWGVMGSNYSKNLTYDGCKFSRFDAHKGTYNAIIRNSEIGHQKISIIGSGTLIIENTVLNSNSIVALRGDYGSTWEGDVILRNITLNNTSTPTLVSAQWNNHYFGYTCYLPENIIIDGITLAKGNSFYVLPNLSSSVDDALVNGAENKNPYVLTRTVTVTNNTKGYTVYVSKNMTLFGDVILTEE